MTKEKLVSICIPTYKREYIVRDMLKSIYSQGVDHSLFEVCITDNSETDETKNVIESEFSGIDNLRYKKVTCKGFLNSQEALKFGSGKFLKLHNDYSFFKEGALQRMINVVKHYEKSKPVIFFSMGELKNKSRILKFHDFNSFMYNINYFSTWSTSFSIWREDLERLLQDGVEVNYMYPHTTLLYRLTEKSLYIVDDYEYVTNVEPKKKGGYNLIDNFVRIYLTMVDDDLLKQGHIDKRTYRRIEKEIIRFVAYWYYTVRHHKDRYTFTFENHNKLIADQCGIGAVIHFHIRYVICAAKGVIKKLLRREA